MPKTSDRCLADAKYNKTLFLLFDVFHLICQITRKLIKTLRRYISLHELSAFIELCNNVLCNEWSDFAISIFASNKALSIYRGKHISSFIKMIPDICGYMKETFAETEYCHNLMNALKLWSSISTFIRRATIYNDKDYDISKEKNKSIC